MAKQTARQLTARRSLVPPERRQTQKPRPEGVIPADQYDEVIADLARFSESLLTEEQVRKRHRFTAAEWAAIDDPEIIQAVENEKLRRIRNGSAKKERAQVHIVKAPDVLDQIMMDDNASPRHRVDAIKTLDTMTGNGPENAPTAGERFIITIDLGGDIQKFDKQIKPMPVIELEANKADP